jgi:hypothetical protein
MSEVVISHLEAIHLTTASDTALSDSNKLEEASAFNFDINNDMGERKNLNSDGWTKTDVLFHSGSGSLEYKVKASGGMADDIEDAAISGDSLYVHVISKPDATAGQKKGTRYELKVESISNSWTGGDYKGGNANFRLNGAPVDIIVPTPP